MNPKILVVVAAVASLVLFGVLIMNDDGSSDGNRETEGGNEFFEWPSVNDPSAGSIKATEIGEEQVTFTAEPSDGCRFVHWIGVGGRIVTDNPVVIPIAESGSWTAVFEVDG